MHQAADAPSAPAGGQRRFTQVAAGVLLVALIVATYLPALHAGFVWDDAEYVTDNATLQSLDGLRRIWLEPSAAPQYYPLTLTTFWIEYHLWGLQPFGYHLVNILLHALSVVVLWQVFRRLRIPGAWLAAALFAVHPINVESVAWISERKNVLSGLFAFGALLAFLEATAIDRHGEPATVDWETYGAACVLLAAGLLSKTTVCALPAVLLLIAWWKRGAIELRAAWLTAPFFALGLLMAAATVAVERHYVQGDFWTRSLLERALAAGRAFWFYLHTLLWPSGLTFIYPRWSVDPSLWWQYLFPATAVLLIGGLYLARARIGRGPLVATLCYAGALLPVSGAFNLYYLQYSFVADRFAYLPSVPWMALATAAGAALAMPAGQSGRRIAVVTGGALVCLLAVLSTLRCRVYETPRALWTDTAAKNPESWLAHNNLGVLLAQAGDTNAAIEHYKAAAQLQPSHPETYLNLANIMQANGNFDEATRLYGMALQLQPAYPTAHYNLGLMWANQGKMQEAIDAYTQALRDRPDYAEAHNSLGAAYQAQRNYEGALAEYSKALELRPDFAAAHYNLASVKAVQGQLAEAVAHYEEALRLHPDDPDGHVNLGNVLRALGETDTAVAQYHAALKLNPAHVEAHNGLGVTLAGQGRLDEATAQFEAAIRAKPDYPEAHSNLGNALLARRAFDDAVAQYQTAIRLRPTYAEARNNLGIALTALGRTDEAIAQFEQAVQASPDLLQARSNLADALLAKGRYAEAIAQYEEVLRVRPGDTDAERHLQQARSAQPGQLAPAQKTRAGK